MLTAMVLVMILAVCINKVVKNQKDKKWEEVRTFNGEVSKNTRYELVNNPDGEANIVVPEVGVYDVYIALDASHFYLMESGKKPGEN